MRTLKFFENKSVIKVWGITSLIILLLPLLIGWIYFVVSSQTLKNEIGNSNKILINQTYNSIDAIIQEMTKLSVRIAADETVASIVKMKYSDITSETVFSTGIVLQSLRNYAILSQHIRSIYLYLPEIDYVVTLNTASSSKAFFEVEYGEGSDISYEKWKNELLSLKRQTIIAKKSPLNTEEMLVTMYPAHINILPGAVIVIGSDIADVLSMGDIYIFDVNDSLIYTNSKEGFVFPTEKMVNDSGEFDLSVGRKDYIVNYVNSTVTRMKYASLVERSQYLQNINFMRNIATVVLTIYLLLGGYILFAVTKRNYNSLQKLVLQISNMNNGFMSAQNEFEYIETVIKDVFDKNISINRQLEKSHDSLLENLKFDLIRGNIESSENKITDLKNVGVDFISDTFCTVLFNFMNPQELFAEDNDLTIEKRSALIVFILDNVLGEVCAGIGKLFMLNLGSNRCVAIINLKLNLEDALDMLELNLNKCFDFAESNFGVNIICTLSNLYFGITNIVNAYKESLLSMSYKIAFDNQRIIRFDTVNKSFSTELSYKYSIEDEFVINNYVKSGDYDNASRALLSVFNKNVHENIYPIPIIRCLIFDLISTILKLANEVLKNDSNKILELSLEIDKLLVLEDLKEIKNTMLYILKQVCEFVQVRSNRQLKDKVTEYVNKNYKNINLSVNLMADDLGFSSAYISTTFKTQYGERLLDYINKIRVENSRELLKNKSFSIEDIAYKVGYTNFRTYVRLFSKQYGITPAKFREANLNNTNKEC